jgi:hypothetical protein
MSQNSFIPLAKSTFLSIIENNQEEGGEVMEIS